MTPNEQAVVDQEESPISLSQCFAKAASAEFIFDVTLSTAVAANDLCIGQIYLFETPLLRESLKAEQIKPRLLGHWGTSPGQNLIYIHLNRLIKAHDANFIYIAGPGHGGAPLNANSYLEGSYTEVHPKNT